MTIRLLHPFAFAAIALSSVALACMTAEPRADTTHPPAPIDSISHEPLGFATLLEYDLAPSPVVSKGRGGGDQDTTYAFANGWTSTYDTTVPASWAFISDLTDPKSPPTVASQWYPAGFQAGASPAILEHGFSATREAYVAYWVWISPNWSGESSSGVNKQIFVWSNGRSCIYTTAQGNGAGPLTPEVHLQCSPTVNLGPNLAPSARFSRGAWHKWELHLVGNTSGQSDGLVEFWLDGEAIGRYANQTIDAGAVNFDSFQWSPTYGGTGGTVPSTPGKQPDGQEQRLAHVRISGKP